MLLHSGKINDDVTMKHVGPRKLINLSTDGNGFLCGSSPIVAFTFRSFPRLYDEGQPVLAGNVREPCFPVWGCFEFKKVNYGFDSRGTRTLHSRI